MTKSQLVQYCDLQQEVRKLEKRIERLKNKPSIVTEMVQSGWKRHAKVTGVDIVRDNVLREKRPLLEKKYEELHRKMHEIIDWIQNIEKSDIRQIFWYRYIDDLKWNEIAANMCIKEDGSYDENVTEASVMMRHNRYLDKMRD